MEKVSFLSPEDGRAAEFYVLEQTRVNGVDYLLVTEEEEEDCDAFILRDISSKDDAEAIYEMVESEEELRAISKVFEEMLEDVELSM